MTPCLHTANEGRWSTRGDGLTRSIRPISFRLHYASSSSRWIGLDVQRKNAHVGTPWIVGNFPQKDKDNRRSEAVDVENQASWGISKSRSFPVVGLTSRWIDYQVTAGGFLSTTWKISGFWVDLGGSQLGWEES